MKTLPGELLHGLEDVATRLRIWSIRATTAAGSGHPTSAASSADLVAALFFDAMRFDPTEPRAVTEAVAEVGIVVHRLAVREIPHSGPAAMLLERYGIGRRALVSRIRELLVDKRAAAA